MVDAEPGILAQQVEHPARELRRRNEEHQRPGNLYDYERRSPEHALAAAFCCSRLQRRQKIRTSGAQRGSQAKEDGAACRNEERQHDTASVEANGVEPGAWMEAPEMATTVRVEDGNTLTTDGPFVAVKEALGGYLFFEADDVDAAIELASRIPAARLGGGIEIRPLKEG